MVERLKTIAEGLAAVVGADHNGDAGVFFQRHALGQRLVSGEEGFDPGVGFLRLPLARDQTEGPIGDFLAAAEPFVGPRVNDRSGQPAAHHALDVPGDHFRLLVFAVADGIHAEFPEHERTVLREVLQAREVAIEVLLTVQVDVEGEKVGVLRQQVFGRGKAGVRIKHLGVHALGQEDEVLDEFGHATRAQPTHHMAGDFIAHEIAENGGMPAVRFDRINHRFLDLAARFALVEEFDVFGPGNGNEATNAVLRTGVEEPARRNIVNAHKIEPGLVHHGEVGLCFVRCAEVFAPGVGGERTIGRALDEKLAVAFAEEFGSDPDGCGETHAVSARPSEGPCREDHGIDHVRAAGQGSGNS